MDAAWLTDKVAKLDTPVSKFKAIRRDGKDTQH